MQANNHFESDMNACPIRRYRSTDQPEALENKLRLIQPLTLSLSVIQRPGSGAEVICPSPYGVTLSDLVRPGQRREHVYSKSSATTRAGRAVVGRERDLDSRETGYK